MSDSKPLAARRAPIDIARAYTLRGWSVTPVAFSGKRPILPDWNNRRLSLDDLAQHFACARVNVGVLLGEASRWLVDVDLDCPEALVLADTLLPPTGAVFGRPSRPRSHRLYLAERLSTRQFKHPGKRDAAMMVELRSTDAQTVFPGSTHESGEPIEWATEDEPAVIGGEELMFGVRKLAAAVLLVRSWTQGARHDYALALAGGLLKAGWMSADVAALLTAVARAAQDEEAERRAGETVNSTAARVAAGESVTGWRKAAEVVGDRKLVDKVREWLCDGTRLSNDPAVPEASGERGDEAEDDEPAADEAGGAKGRSKAQRLAEILSSVVMVRSPTGRAYALIDGTARACDSSDFRAWCSSQFWRAYHDTIAEGTVRDVVRALTGGALPTRVIPVRVGGDNIRVVLDLGASARAVTAAGIEPAPDDAVFARPLGGQALPEPIVPANSSQAAAAIEALRVTLGVERRAWSACVAWLLAALRPQGPYPLLYVRGGQGSGKSTLARALRSLIDPRRPDMGAMPRDPRDLAIAAEHAHVLAIDNVSKIPSEMSDALCRLATGDGFAIRALFSDRDLATFDAARPMIIASIVDATARADLLDRALIVDLPMREERRDDSEIHAAVGAHRPHVLGALLFGVSRALGGGEMMIPPAVRMREPAAFAARAAPALGLDADAIVSAYLESRTAAHGAIADDPVIDAVLGFLSAGSSWEGTMTSLLSLLEGKRIAGPRPRGWPDTPKGLGAALRRLAPTFGVYGVRHVAPDGRAGHEKARIHRLERSTT